MKSSEVKVGGHYSAKVSDKLTVVRIDGEHPSGGWEATNVATGKKIRIKTAQRLRGRASAPQKAPSSADAAKATEGATPGAGGEASGDTAQQGGNTGKATKRSKKKLTKKERDALKAQHKADQENAAKRDEREASPDGMTASERAMAESEQDKPERKPRKKRTGPSLIEAAIQVLGENGGPMTCSQMIEKIFEQNLWSTAGKTPAQTLYSAILRQVQKKGDDAPFVHVERGKFDLNPNQKEG